jgi:hypothetical protein
MNWKHNIELTEYSTSHLGIKYKLTFEPKSGGWIIQVIPQKIFWLRANNGFETWSDRGERAMQIAENFAKERNWLNIWWLKFDKDIKIIEYDGVCGGINSKTGEFIPLKIDENGGMSPRYPNRTYTDYLCVADFKERGKFALYAEKNSATGKILEIYFDETLYLQSNRRGPFTKTVRNYCDVNAYLKDKTLIIKSCSN